MIMPKNKNNFVALDVINDRSGKSCPDHNLSSTELPIIRRLGLCRFERNNLSLIGPKTAANGVCRCLIPSSHLPIIITFIQPLAGCSSNVLVRSHDHPSPVSLRASCTPTTVRQGFVPFHRRQSTHLQAFQSTNHRGALIQESIIPLQERGLRRRHYYGAEWGKRRSSPSTSRIHPL